MGSTLPTIDSSSAAPDLSTTPPLVLASTSLAPAGPVGECNVFGDPHVVTFDGQHSSFYTAGEYWTVKATTIHIQARYQPTPITHGLSVVKEIAVGGLFLKDSSGSAHVLRISARSATFDDAPILKGFPDSWSSTDPAITLRLDDQGELLHKGREGKQMKVVHATLPEGVEMQINRWTEASEGDYINVRVRMSARDGQDGHCGNFNGDPSDDTRTAIRERIGKTGVPKEELLFKTKTPVVPVDRPDLNNCPDERSKEAREVCVEQANGGLPTQECMLDVCFGGKEFAYDA